MRIVGGNYRGKKLVFTPDPLLRPTKDRLRESVFNIIDSLGFSFLGKRVVDVYAGTGAFGFEAFSRGAVEITFIDHHAPSQQIIAKNISLFPNHAPFHLSRKRAQDFFKKKNPHPPFDFVFMDPPYDDLSFMPLLPHQLQNGWVNEGTLTILEIQAKTTFDYTPCTILTKRTYGSTQFIFYTLP